MGFGTSPTIFNDQIGLSNADEGLRMIVSNPRVKAATIISPHVYGKEITGDITILPFCCNRKLKASRLLQRLAYKSSSRDNMLVQCTRHAKGQFSLLRLQKGIFLEAKHEEAVRPPTLAKCS